MINTRDRLDEHLDAMLMALADERKALETHDAEALQMATARKAAAADALSTCVAQDPTCASILSSSDALAAKARRAQDYNVVNGKILNRTQQSTRVLLGILSGKSPDEINGLYRESGQQTAGRGGTGHALAQV